MQRTDWEGKKEVIRIDVDQGSPQWLAARLGIPTASQFHRIITPKTCKLSAAADEYMHELLAEYFTGESVQAADNQYMERGRAMEPEAVAWYEYQFDVETERVGFCLRDDRSCGASPDRLVGDDGLLEVKCPSLTTHIGYLLDQGGAYRCQLQGQLYVTGRKWIDFCSYNPAVKPDVYHFERDEDFISLLDTAIKNFVLRLNDARTKLEAKGCVRAIPKGTHCQAKREDGSECYGSIGLVQTAQGWRCMACKDEEGDSFERT